MKIASIDMYGDYYDNDRCFDQKNCTIGQNLLYPKIMLKRKLELNGDEFHTFDLYDYNPKNVDKFIFQDIPESFITYSFEELIKLTIKKMLYLASGSRVYNYVDKFKIVTKKVNPQNLLLIMQEPPVVSKKSYDIRYHEYFSKILTWDDSLVDNKKYFKYFYPQPVPEKKYFNEYKNKRMLVMMCGNKKSKFPGELYSKRLEAIKYFEKIDFDFDLYGFGWEVSDYKSYKGMVDDKLETISKYKYCLCYENMSGVKGYITEKIFDCFFSNTVPIYWGADNIKDYIPSSCFIDKRDFKNYEDLVKYIRNINENEYNNYLDSIKEFLNSYKFKEYFSVESYVNRIVEML